MKERLDEIAGQTIGAGIEVHRELGPGLLESAYGCCFCFELVKRGVKWLVDQGIKGVVDHFPD